MDQFSPTRVEGFLDQTLTRGKLGVRGGGDVIAVCCGVPWGKMGDAVAPEKKKKRPKNILVKKMAKNAGSGNNQTISTLGDILG